MPCLLDGETIVSLTEGLVSARRQQGTASLDLTVSRISRVESGGALDFGGSEYQEASTAPLTPEKKSAEESYGWWNLGPGAYLVTFNETIQATKHGVILVVPHSRLVAAGASHAPVIVDVLDGERRVLLNVGPGGLAIKENARVSRAVLLNGGQ
jgi:hypothetical protein